MNNTLAIALLNQASNGYELLAVLDSLVDDSNADAVAAQDEEFVHLPVLNENVPTLEEIAF